MSIEDSLWLQCPSNAWTLLLQRTRERKVVPFIGAGISVPLVPTWMELLRAVATDGAAAGSAAAAAAATPPPPLPVAASSPHTAPRAAVAAADAISGGSAAGGGAEPRGAEAAAPAASAAAATTIKPRAPASTATRRPGALVAASMCANCGADAPLYCKACAAALCAECSKFVHGAAPFTKMMSKHEPRPREEAAFDMLVARLGGDLPCVSESLLASLPAGGLAAAAERVVWAGLTTAACIVLAGDEALRRRVIPSGGSPTVKELEARVRALGERAPPVIYRSLAMGRRLASHVAVVTGPFPVVITTNWDELLEAGFQLLRYCDDQITCPGRTVEYIHGRQGETLPVRYRKDVAQLYAEIKAGLHPSRRWKLHGDFSPRGRDEFVCGHADYRKLISSDIGCMNLLKHLCSSYSFLFYGYSLSDRDLLQSMDDMMESFGSEIGPHFWITAQDIEAERAEYLLAHYAIHTIQVKPYDFAAQAALLEQLCREGWAQPKGHAFRTAEYALAWDGERGAAQSLILCATPLDVPVGVARNVSELPGHATDRYVAMGINLGRHRGGELIGGGMLIACEAFARAVRTGKRERPFADTGGVLERAVAWGTTTPAMEAAGINHYFFVNALDDGGVLMRDAGERCKLFLATRHFLIRALAAACSVTPAVIATMFDSDDELLHRGGGSEGTASGGGGVAAPLPPPPSMVRMRSQVDAPPSPAPARALDPSKFPSGGVHIYMPLFATGIDQLTSHEACFVQTSAVGDLAAEMRRRRMVLPKLVVTMCLWDPALIDEVGSGRMQLGSVLSRAFDGNMKINTLVHDGAKGWTQRTALVPLRDSTFDLLRAVILARSLPLPPRVTSPFETLLSAGVCEGSLEVFAADAAVRAKLIGTSS